MLWSIAFDRLGVVVSDLYFVDPRPAVGQEGAERGVRVELRVFDRGPLQGSIYSATPIRVDRPLWRVDLLESVENPGSLDRAHHHPRFTGWEPGPRQFVDALSADPLGWLERRLTRFDDVLAEAAVPEADVGAADVEDVRTAAPEIVAAVRRLLDRVRAGELARPPSGVAAAARVSWL